MAEIPLQWRQCSCHDRGVAPWSRWIRSDRKAAVRKWMGESSCSGRGCHMRQGKLCHPCFTSQTDMIRPWGICCIQQTKSWGLCWCWHYIIIWWLKWGAMQTIYYFLFLGPHSSATNVDAHIFKGSSSLFLSGTHFLSFMCPVGTHGIVSPYMSISQNCCFYRK